MGSYQQGGDLKGGAPSCGSYGGDGGEGSLGGDVGEGSLGGDTGRTRDFGGIKITVVTFIFFTI